MSCNIGSATADIGGSREDLLHYFMSLQFEERTNVFLFCLMKHSLIRCMWSFRLLLYLRVFPLA